MDSKTAAILSYITWVGWVIALVTRGTQDELVKHHMNQALILNICASVVGMVGTGLAWIPIIKILSSIVVTVVEIGLFILTIKGYHIRIQ